MKKDEIFIVVENGVVCEVLSPVDLKITIIDRDVQGCGMVSVIEGKPADIQETDCNVNPARYEAILRDMKKGLVDYP